MVNELKIMNKRCSLVFNKTCWNNNLLPIYIEVKLMTIVEGDPEAPFSVATTPKCRVGRYSFPGLLHLPLIRTLQCWVLSKKASSIIFDRPVGWAVIDPATKWSMACNTSLWPLLGLTRGRIGSDPINRLVPTFPSTYVCFSLDRIIQSALVELFDLLLRNYFQPFIPYVLEGRGWGSIVLRGRTYDRCEIVV